VLENAEPLVSRAGVAGKTEAPADMPRKMHEGVHVDPDGMSSGSARHSTEPLQAF
jgi:hypothetical protein